MQWREGETPAARPGQGGHTVVGMSLKSSGWIVAGEAYSGPQGKDHGLYGGGNIEGAAGPRPAAVAGACREKAAASDGRAVNESYVDLGEERGLRVSAGKWTSQSAN